MPAHNSFYQAHIKQFGAALVTIIAVISFQIIVEDSDWLNKNKGAVLGETIKSQSIKQEKTAEQSRLTYQNQIRKKITNYLKKRAAFIKPHQDWLILINNFKYDLLKMSVPDAYRDFHLKLLTLLEREKKAVDSGNSAELDKVNNDWQRLLKQFFWISG